MIKIIDNFLTKSYFNKIEELITSLEFEWFYTQNITDVTSPKLGYAGFGHPLYLNNEPLSGGFSFILSEFYFKTIDTFGLKGEILKSRVDMTLYSSTKKIHQPHVDFVDPFHTDSLTTILYLTDNLDSETIIYDKKVTCEEDMKDLSDLKVKKRIHPKKNRLVAFDGSYLHTGHSPVYENHRILINSNFK